MITKPIYCFTSGNSFGLVNVPDNALVQVQNYEGTGTLYFTLLTKASLTGAHTVSDFLNLANPRTNYRKLGAKTFLDYNYAENIMHITMP